MKKTNLFKKMTAMALAAMMILSAVPMMASAATPDGSYWVELGKFTYDGTNETVAENQMTETYTKTVGGREQKTIIEGNESKVNWRNGPTKLEDFISYMSTVGSEKIMAGSPLVTGEFGLQLNKSQVDGIINGSKHNIQVYDLFDTDAANLQIGDKVRISTWVFPTHPCKKTASGVSYLGVDGNDDGLECSIRMWLWEPGQMIDGAWTDMYQSANPGNWSGSVYADEAFVGKVPFAQWSKVSIEYDIEKHTWHKGNQDKSTIKMDTHNIADAEFYFPQYALISGFTAEKLVKAGGAYSIAENGTVSGAVTAGVEESDENTKVIVAAYDGDMFLGCEIKPYTTAGSYDFSIAEAGDADKVMAYIWDMSKFEPQITPITLKIG